MKRKIGYVLTLIVTLLAAGIPLPSWNVVASGTIPTLKRGCTDVIALAETKGWIYHQEVEDNGHLVELLGDDVLPEGFEAVGDEKTIKLSDVDRQMKAGWWTVYGRCLGYLPHIEKKPYSTPTPDPTPTPIPTATPVGVYCLNKTEQLAEQLGVEATRLHMDLFDGFNDQPAGWRMDYGPELISWVVPMEYIVNHPEGEFRGDGQRNLDFRVGSIWLPWSCRK